MSALAAVLIVVALAAVSSVDATIRWPGPWQSENSCFDPSTCTHSSTWAVPGSSLCVVVWHDEPIPQRQTTFDSSFADTITIDFDGSTIQKLYGCYMRGLEHIENIHMDGVGLESVTSDALDALPDLWLLSLAHNLLTSLPEQVFLQNHRLYLLSLGDNPLRVSPGQPLVTSSSLQVLDLADCRITAVDSATFQQLPSLRKLYLAGNLLSELPADAMAPVGQLTHLFLQSNHLLFFPSAAIQKLPQLQEVQLDNNTAMQGPLGPLVAPKLHSLTAAGCSLQSVQPNLLATAPELRYLRLSRNQVHTLWLANESVDARLVLLDMTGNPLECDCALRDSFMWAEDHVNVSRVFCGKPPRSWRDAQLHRLNCNLPTSIEAGASADAFTGGVGRVVGVVAVWVWVSVAVGCAGYRG